MEDLPTICPLCRIKSRKIKLGESYKIKYCKKCNEEGDEMLKAFIPKEIGGKL